MTIRIEELIGDRLRDPVKFVISEAIGICGVDHGGDPASVEGWNANAQEALHDAEVAYIAYGPSTAIATYHNEQLPVGVAAMRRLGLGAGPAHITVLYVLPGYSRHGVGKMLLTMLEGWAARRGHERVLLFSSATARHFYYKQGYRETGHLAVQGAGRTWNFPMVKYFGEKA